MIPYSSIDTTNQLIASDFVPPPGAWILDLLTLPTKFLTKRLKELRSVFQSSFNQTPCLKFSTKGPLTLKDLQQLKPSHSEISHTECQAADSERWEEVYRWSTSP